MGKAWDQPPESVKQPAAILAMVETAFFASTASLLWLVNYYLPLGPLLRIFLGVPIALTYLRWGARAAWMGALTAGLLLSVLMGPTRSVVFIIPYGLLGVLLGFLWRRGANWGISIGLGTLLAALGFFFRLGLVSILVGEDLWLYLTTQITFFVEWLFLRLGLLIQPSLLVVQIFALGSVLLNSVMYLFGVHVAAQLLLERLGNPIPPPPAWVTAILRSDD